MFSVLKIIFRRDKIAAPCFDASQLQIAFILPLRILGKPRDVDVGGFAFP